MNKKYDIFISYRNRCGRHEAERLYAKLREDGYNVFLDRNEMHGGDFREQLMNGVENCKDFILVVNNNTFDRMLGNNFRDNARDWVKDELTRAIKTEKNIIPAICDVGYAFPQDLPNDIEAIVNIQTIDFSLDFDRSYKILKKSYLISKRNFFKNRQLLLILFLLFVIFVSIGSIIWKKISDAFFDNRIKKFVELYCDATNNNNIPEIEKLYVPQVKRFYDSYDISRDSVIKCYRRYEKRFMAHNPKTIVQWETLKTNKMKDGMIKLSFTEFYMLDREDTTKDNMFILDKFFVLDDNYKIIKEYEEKIESK